MRIDGGSQNVSRMPGVFVYPVHRYSNQAIQPTAAVAPRFSPERSSLSLEQLRGVTSDYSSRAFGRPEGASPGLFLDLTV